MEDYQIVDLYWARNETAITVTAQKYGRMLQSLSYSLLHSMEDAEECVNDTYLSAWQAMPDARPMYLGPFLSKITRRLSIDRWRHDHREKRGGLEAITEELTECIPDATSVEAEYENGRLSRELNAFLESLSAERRVMFLRRYFYSQSIPEIAQGMHMSESKIKVTLHRLREKLHDRLEAKDLL